MAVAPNHQKLIIANKNYKGVNDPYARDMRAIEMWANEGIVRKLIAGANITLTPSDGVDQGQGIEVAASGGGGGGYASLTGPGQSTTPGDLTQAGGFFVNVPVVVFGQQAFLSMPSSGGQYGWAVLQGIDRAELNSIGSSGETIVSSGTGPGGGGLTSVTGNTSTGVVQVFAHSTLIGTGGTGLLGFYGSTPGVTIQNVVNSRGGNLALASLLTSLQNLGLIIDSTTP